MGKTRVSKLPTLVQPPSLCKRRSEVECLGERRCEKGKVATLVSRTKLPSPLPAHKKAMGFQFARSSSKSKMTASFLVEFFFYFVERESCSIALRLPFVNVGAPQGRLPHKSCGARYVLAILYRVCEKMCSRCGRHAHTGPWCV